ncbi:acyltransferase [Pseudoalteromonas phenolica]|uniref:acyltransferase n=1 Tax=Pseudoalteromonas phenolica TaxID=161398 RepID=UPI00384D65A1
MIWLDNSRIIAIYAVVLLHVSAGIVTGNDVGTEYWWVGNVYDSAVRWCVPVFVMISGALLLDPAKQEDLATFYTKRLSRILVPIMFWSAFFLAWAFLKGVMKGNELTVVDLLKKLLTGKPHYHMWFLYMIISLYLFTPFFRKIVTHSSKRELSVLIFISFVISILNYAYGKFFSGGSKLFINWFLLYIPFFFLGYLIRQDNRNPKKSILWLVFIISIIFTFVGFYIMAINSSLDVGLYFYGYLSITVIPMSISIMYILIDMEQTSY